MIISDSAVAAWGAEGNQSLTMHRLFASVFFKYHYQSVHMEISLVLMVRACTSSNTNIVLVQ